MNWMERDSMTEKKTSPDEAQDGKEKSETTPPPKIIKDWGPRTIRLGQNRPEEDKESSPNDDVQ